MRAKKTGPFSVVLSHAPSRISTTANSAHPGGVQLALCDGSVRFVGDENWSRGDKLIDYQFVSDGEPFGTGVRFSVLLKLNNAYTSKPARYQVAIQPLVSIMRDDSDEE